MRELTWSEIVWLDGERVGVELVFVAVLQVWEGGLVDVRMRGRHPLRRLLTGVQTEIRRGRTTSTTMPASTLEGRVVASATEVWQPGVRSMRTALRGSSRARVLDPTEIVRTFAPDVHDVDIADRASEVRARMQRLARSHADVCDGLRRDIERATVPFWVLAASGPARPRIEVPTRSPRARDRDWLRGWKRLNPRPPSATD